MNQSVSNESKPSTRPPTCWSVLLMEIKIPYIVRLVEACSKVHAKNVFFFANKPNENDPSLLSARTRDMT